MTIAEKLYFVRHLREAFSSIGAVIPTSRYASEAMAAECARRTGARTILEVGSGTGPITAEIIKHMGSDDRLVLCEINPGFVAFLRRRFEQEPAFRRVRDQVTIHEMSVTELPGSQQFDCIISAVPFTSLPPELTEAILARYHDLLRPGGVLTYIEYAFMRALKHGISSADARNRAEAVNAIVDRYIEAYQFRRDLVWRNVPPAWIRQLRFEQPQPADALKLTPLEHTNRISVAGATIASDALPFVAGLVSLGLLLRLRGQRRGTGSGAVSGSWLWALPMLLAAVVAWFFRDPRRQVLPNPSVAYAACDGRVLSVERLYDQRFGGEEWLRIAVFLSLANVHINRAPVGGKVEQIIYEEGGYAAANMAEAEHNNAQYTLIASPQGRCVVAQRVGLVARRIVNRSRPGDLLAQGERYGLIRFGSRTDVYLPAALAKPSVAVGDKVVGGLTVIARFN